MTAGADAAAGARNARATAIGVVGIDALAYAFVLPHLPVVVGEQAPWWTVGLLFAAYSTAQFVMLGPLARAASRYGIRPVVVVCLLGTTAGLVLTALSTSYWVLLAGRVIDGASAGTVVVVTATTLTWFDSRSWAAELGRLAAARGAAALLGILATAVFGLMVDTPGRALRIAAWVGVGLTGLAMTVAVRLRVNQAQTLPAARPSRPQLEWEWSLASHLSAQAGQAGLVVLAPALGLIAGNQTISFLAPAAAIIGMAVGQLALGHRSESWWWIGFSGVMLGAVLIPFASTVLIGLAIIGVAIGGAVPGAHSRLLRRAVSRGASEFEANAMAGRAAIAGQVGGPAIGYAALGLHRIAASAALAGFGLGAMVRREVGTS